MPFSTTKAVIALRALVLRARCACRRSSTSASGPLVIHIFDAVGDPAIALLLGAARHGAHDVGAGARLAHRERAHELAGAELRQVLAPLRLAAVQVAGCSRTGSSGRRRRVPPRPRRARLPPSPPRARGSPGPCRRSPPAPSCRAGPARPACATCRRGTRCFASISAARGASSASHMRFTVSRSASNSSVRWVSNSMPAPLGGRVVRPVMPRAAWRRSSWGAEL